MLISAAGGNIQTLPFYTAGYGLQTPFGVLLPPGSQVACYLRSTGPQSGDDPGVAQNGMLVATLAAALQRVRSGLGDTIIVLPGHSESVVDNTMLTNLVSGTRIIGIEAGGLTPTFRWTAVAASWLVNQANVVIQGLRLRMEGANGVTLAMNISGADCKLFANDIETGSGATAGCLQAVSITAGATRCKIIGNTFRSVTYGNTTDGILVGAAVDGIEILNNEMVMGVTVSTTKGLITWSGAATNCRIGGNILVNNVASTCALAIADVASSGAVYNNFVSVLTNGAAASIGIIIAASTTHTIRFFENKVSDEAGKSGVLNPAAAG